MRQNFLCDVKPDIRPLVTGRAEPLVLSFAQQRLWLSSHMAASGAHRIAFGLRLSGDLDRGALRQALDRVVARHEALRCTFHYADSLLAQRVAAAAGFALEENDLRGRSDAEAELRRLVEEDGEAAFDLEAGPLARGRLIRIAESEHVLFISLHRIVSDDGSVDVLKGELSALYGAFVEGRADPLRELAVQYPDYAAWQRLQLTGELLQAQSDFWRGALSGAPTVLELPADHRRPAQQDYAGGFLELELAEPLTTALKSLSDRYGTRLSTTLLAGWAALLARLSGQRDLVIGAPVPYRLHPEVEPLIGAFENALPLRLDLSGEPTVGEFIDRVETRVLEAQRHQDLRFEKIVEILDPPRSLAHEPVFQVTFAWRDGEPADFSLPGLSVAPLNMHSSPVAFDLTLRLAEHAGRIVGGLEYATALFERTTVERYAGYLRRLLEAFAADDAQTVDRLPLLGEAERHRLLVEWNATQSDFPQDKCVHELFEAQVERTPNALAIAYADEQAAYAELNARANRLAHHLRTLGVRPDERVAVCMERSPEMVVGLLGILKAGGAYLPMDPAYPAERLAYMLEDSAPVAVLCHGPARASLEGAIAGLTLPPPILMLDAPGPWDRQRATNADPAEIGLTPRHLAYVIYTSGSTGVPKGVMVEHKSCTNRISAQEAITPLQNDAVFAQKTALGFVDSFFETLVPLTHGKLLAIIPVKIAKDAISLVSLLSQLRISNLLTIPSLAAIIDLERDDLSTLRHWTMSGEVINCSVAHNILLHLPECRLTNVYGSTEVTADATFYRISGAEVGTIPIGRPLPNVRIYILDNNREPVATGAPGEIYVGGVAVARGYLNRPDLTAERFFASPFVTEDRLFRTGDLGRYLPDGNIEFLGRTDFQVKIRGFRVELGEIEARLTQHPAVRHAVVLVREDTQGDKRLAAYYTVTPAAEAPGVAALRAHLAATLPDYMVPSAYMRLETLPMTANGKLDRKALPAPDVDAYAARAYEPPQGKTEETLARIFAAKLRIKQVGRHDDFFDLGGDSLLSIEVVFEIERVLGRKLATGILFADPTVAGLAANVDNSPDTGRPISLVPLHTGESGTPIFMIHLIERDLARHLSRRRPVYGLSYGLAAVGGGANIPLPQSIESVATHYIDEMRSVQPHGPYLLIGHSLGGQIGYEMAQQLIAAGERVDFLGLIDSDAPDPARKLHPLPLGRVFRNVLRIPPKKLLSHFNGRLNESSLVRRTKIRFYPTQSSFRWRLHEIRAADYRPKPYYDRLDLFVATVPQPYIRHEPPPPPEVAWRGLALGGLVVHRIPGGHLDIVKHPVAAIAAQAIESAIDSRATVPEKAR